MTSVSPARFQSAIPARHDSVRASRGEFSRRFASIHNAGASPSETPSANSSGFSQAATSFATHIPRFSSVPEGAQWPRGPYKQAPAEYGSEWWRINPFSGEQPWVRATEIEAAASAPADVDQPPGDFLKIFGPRPERNDTTSRSEFWRENFVWQRELDRFEGVGVPDGFTEAQVEAAGKVFEAWGMGKPVFYKSGDSWAARFPDSALPDFQINPESAITAPQVIVAHYQIRALRQGLAVDKPHPWLPSSLFVGDSSTANA